MLPEVSVMLEERAMLLSWSGACGTALGLEDLVVDNEALHILLDLSRDAAHQVIRPASPLTAYLVGVAVGRGMSLGRAAALATELALAEGTAIREHAGLVSPA